MVQSRAQSHPALPPFGPGWAGEHVRYTPELCPNTDGIFGAMVCVALVPRYTDQDVTDIGAAIAKVWAGRPAALLG